MARKQRGYVVKEVDLTDPENLRDVLTPKTKIIYFETVTNPNLRVYDLAAVARLAKEINPEVVIIVDNTFPSPPGFMVSFIPTGKGEEEQVAQARKIVDYIAQHGKGVITHAVSLGGNKSLIEMPFLGTHATVSDEDKVRWGIDPALIRLSVGMAHSDDQLRLLDKAIRHAYG